MIIHDRPSDDLRGQEQDCKPRTKSPTKSSGASQGIVRKTVLVRTVQSGESAETDGRARILSLNRDFLSLRDTVQCGGDEKQV
jgi:hypothetical protein